MEGQQVGTGNFDTSNPNQGIASTSTMAKPSLAHLAPLKQNDREILSLLWPTNLINELSNSAHARTHWSTPLAIIAFILSSIIAVVLGPVQLLLLIITSDYLFVTTTYFPAALQISMIVSGIVTIMIIVALVQTWREQPRHSLMNGIFGIGSALMFFVMWLIMFGASLRPHILSIILLLIFTATLAGALMARKSAYTTEQNHLVLHALLLLAGLLAIVETVFDATFIIMQISGAERTQSALEQLGEAQAAARSEEISNELSDLVFTICGDKYDIIYLPNDPTNTGLFQCKNSQDVYIMTGPLAAQTDFRTDSVVTGSAFYLGTTNSDFINTYLSPETGVKYLYRDLTSTENPSELVLLAPADSEATLIDTLAEPLTSLINANATSGKAMRISIFYNPELNSVYTTKDYIIVAAADTLALIDYLPNGKSLSGYVNGRSGTYLYRPDNELQALVSLGANPVAYSNQTRAAITNNRHISLLAEPRTYSTEEVRSIMELSFFDPSTTNTDSTTEVVDGSIE